MFGHIKETRELFTMTWLYLVLTKQLPVQYIIILKMKCNTGQDLMNKQMVAEEAENKQEAGQSHRRMAVSLPKYDKQFR